MKRPQLFSLKSIGLVFLLSLFLIQCTQDKNPKKIDPAFTGYITAFTGGIVSNQSSIRIRLAEAYPKAEAQQKIDKDLFDFSPNIKGQAFWIDEQTIEFKPTEKLASGKLFEGEFYLSKLLKVPTKLKTFVFHFQVMKQSMEVEFEGLEAYTTKNLKWQMVNGSVLTYDYAEASVLENSISVTQNGKDLSVRWEHQDGGKLHRFVVDSMQRTENRGQIILEWNGKKLGFDGNGEKEFNIPLGRI